MLCRCSLKGEALQGFTVRQPVCLTLHTADKFGNIRAAGSEDVEVKICGPVGMRFYDCQKSQILVILINDMS